MNMSLTSSSTASSRHNSIVDAIEESPGNAGFTSSLKERYHLACELATQGRLLNARTLFEELYEQAQLPQLRACIDNDLGTLAALNGDLPTAIGRFKSALLTDPECITAQANLAKLQLHVGTGSRERPAQTIVRAIGLRKTRVAIVSMLFNWPSTGGGTIHTAEAGKFLGLAGYEVRHFYSRFYEWGIGRMDQEPLAPSVVIDFDETSWNATEIGRRFRQAVDHFAPDFVIVTDSWNFKPLLAEAMQGYRYFLRLAAQECLCPLNNVRLLVDDQGQFSACPKHQFATPDSCRKCVRERGLQSGGLHQAERALSGYGSAEYDQRLREAFENAEGVLAVNPLIAAAISPYSKRVCIVPSGFDSRRFPWTKGELWDGERTAQRTTLLFAGLIEEFMKGFHVLRAACQQLWHKRQDFELVVTGQAPERPDEFCRYIGWQTQEQLPVQIRAADILVFPTIAEEALGRSAVEAMGAGRPVIASRIGGLQFTVTDGSTGLLFEPGNIEDLILKIETLLDDPETRQRMGQAGRARFESQFTWDAIISQHYSALLGPPNREYTDEELQNLRIAPGESVVLGCTLAIQNRPAHVLERTLQTYAYQSVQPADRVLLDYGSEASYYAAYRGACDRYGWRLISVKPDNPTYNRSAANNLAISFLDPCVNLVFKGDVDVLLGPDVLKSAAHSGQDRLCIFSCLTTTAATTYPTDFLRPEQFQQLCVDTPPLIPMDGEGVVAFPRRWFEQIGGFDLNFETWGFEDSDLRLRASWSIGFEQLAERTIIHQWHPRSETEPAIQRGWEYYQSTKPLRQVVRNAGQLSPRNTIVIIPDRRNNIRTTDPNHSTFVPQKVQVAIATRSLYEELYQISGEFLNFDSTNDDCPFEFSRYRIVGTSARNYFQQLLSLDADWVVNIDEDAFLIDQSALLELIQFMNAGGYAACGMPDGGVIPIRRHHPIACNAFFNIFDLRRIRRIWSDWKCATQSTCSPEFERLVPPFAKRCRLAFDDFEPYYGLFFSILAANEKILYLDANQWDDGISTFLKTPTGKSFLLHAWYAREWGTDSSTFERYRRLIDFARQCQLRNLKVHACDSVATAGNG
ncbi:MAG: mshA 4 [Planctomycetaceae bacterium]|nr:mshA 4 [Planctomycetaceae bacterium]